MLKKRDIASCREILSQNPSTDSGALPVLERRQHGVPNHHNPFAGQAVADDIREVGRAL